MREYWIFKGDSNFNVAYPCGFYDIVSTEPPVNDPDMYDRESKMEAVHVIEYSAYDLMKHDCVKAEMTAHHMNEYICELKAKLDMAIEALEIYKNIDNYDIEGGFNYDDYETTSWDYAKQTLERLK